MVEEQLYGSKKYTQYTECYKKTYENLKPSELPTVDGARCHQSKYFNFFAKANPEYKILTKYFNAYINYSKNKKLKPNLNFNNVGIVLITPLYVFHFNAF